MMYKVMHYEQYRIVRNCLRQRRPQPDTDCLYRWNYNVTNDIKGHAIQTILNCSQLSSRRQSWPDMFSELFWRLCLEPFSSASSRWFVRNKRAMLLGSWESINTKDSLSFTNWCGNKTISNFKATSFMGSFTAVRLQAPAGSFRSALSLKNNRNDIGSGQCYTAFWAYNISSNYHWQSSFTNSAHGCATSSPYPSLVFVDEDLTFSNKKSEYIIWINQDNWTVQKSDHLYRWNQM